MQSKVTPKKAGSGLEQRGGYIKRHGARGWLGEYPLKRRRLCIAQIVRKTPVFRPVLQLNQSSLCSLHSRNQGKEDQMARLSA